MRIGNKGNGKGEKIGKGAFAGRSELKTLVIPGSATKLPPFQDFKTCDALTIRASKGSCAEEYAKEYKKRFKAIK